MAPPTTRRERLHKLIDLARIYSGLSRGAVSERLSRDSTNVYPDGDNPKLDFLVALSDLLQWPVEAVADFIWDGPGLVESAEAEGFPAGFEGLDTVARELHRAGKYADMVRVARRMLAVAATPEERARAYNREHGGWDGMGRYANALAAACRGLEQSPVGVHRRRQLQANLANSHYVLGELTSALAHSSMLVEQYQADPPADTPARQNCAFAYYVRGSTFRSLMAVDQADRARHANLAKGDLNRARCMYDDLSAEAGFERVGGIANTCRAGIVESDVELGLVDAEAGLAQLMSGLECDVAAASALAGDWLESYGWWSIIGGTIALRHLRGHAMQRAVAIFSNKAVEIADKLDNWALRQRALSMEFAAHFELAETTGINLDLTIDDDDVRLIAGTMGRFPAFRETGWRMLRTAKLVRE